MFQTCSCGILSGEVRRSGMAMPLHEVLEPLMEGRRKTVRTLARVAKQTRLDTVALARRIGELERLIAGEDPIEAAARHRTAAWDRARPRVSVIVPLYNHGDHVRSALDSVERNRYRDLELIVVDDASTDLGGDVAQAWMAEHDHLPALLLRHPVNRGLPATRNAAIERARGELVLPLDSDNELFANCLERLVAALDADPGAAFAYGMLQGVGTEGPETIFGYYGWEPERLTYDNYIDALALTRRGVFDQVGGYSTEAELHGWEDYDLWCTLAERGMRGAHVREFVARYRIGAGSMIQFTGISIDDAKARLVERHPRLFAEGVAA
ncbi:MAG: glycosyltransferase [Solirubrobacterales bacterium]|nr:glycosyltransferase [Solirubrobacterales bacterium]